MKVTFDSNVWRVVSSPDKFPKESALSDFRKIREAIVSGRVIPYICETVFTLEAIKRANRKEFFSVPNSKTKVITSEVNGGAVVSFSVGPDKSVHPGNNAYLNMHLQDALKIGFNIVKFPRIGGVQNPDIEQHLYKHEELGTYLEKIFEVGKIIEERGAGFAQIKKIGEAYANIWFDGLQKAPSNEDGLIANAVAEWADGDSVACHIGVGGDYFCTRDLAKKAGEGSVLAQNNLEWLKSDFGFTIISPEDLSAKLRS